MRWGRHGAQFNGWVVEISNFVERRSVSPLPSPPPCREREHFSGADWYRAFFEVMGRRRPFRLKPVPLLNDGFGVAPSPGTGGRLAEPRQCWGGGQTSASAETKKSPKSKTNYTAAMIPTPTANIARARELRRALTPPERTLWKLLRAHQMDGLPRAAGIPSEITPPTSRAATRTSLSNSMGARTTEHNRPMPTAISFCANWAGRRFALPTAI